MTLDSKGGLEREGPQKFGGWWAGRKPFWMSIKRRTVWGVVGDVDIILGVGVSVCGTGVEFVVLLE